MKIDQQSPDAAAIATIDQLQARIHALEEMVRLQAANLALYRKITAAAK